MGGLEINILKSTYAKTKITMIIILCLFSLATSATTLRGCKTALRVLNSATFVNV